MLFYHLAIFFYSVQIVVFHIRCLILRETLTYWNMYRRHVKTCCRFKSWRNQECFPWWKDIEGRHDSSSQTSEDFPCRTGNRIVISSLESSWNMQEDEIHFRIDFLTMRDIQYCSKLFFCIKILIAGSTQVDSRKTSLRVWKRLCL